MIYHIMKDETYSLDVFDHLETKPIKIGLGDNSVLDMRAEFDSNPSWEGHKIEVDSKPKKRENGHNSAYRH